MTKITVHYYDTTCTKIVRTANYATPLAATRAMARARAKGQASGLAGKRTASDQPTAHH